MEYVLGHFLQVSTEQLNSINHSIAITSSTMESKRFFFVAQMSDFPRGDIKNSL